MKPLKVLVTGAGTGIGREIALEFARHGAKVALHYSQSGRGAKSAVRAIGKNAAAFQADFRDVTAIRQLARQAVKFLGGLDVLVNNAGITMNLAFDKVTPEQWDTLYQVNVRAQFFLTQAVLPALTKSRGAIVNITSIHAFQGFTEHAVYAGTKGAIVAYTRELAIELAPRGIRVNAIAPGAVAVENHQKVIPNFDPQAIGKLIPAGFMATPRDVANAVRFLASPAARYFLGQTLIMDGGTTAWMPFSEDYREPMRGLTFGKGYVPGI
ncbi:MAG: 3-oxoacyl-[acyl-carrier-protein] reductase FabG [Verrucomicrobiae bacterium]|nr:3-oxoacyl-[acyl-carrier-protein] reductase FabG [Verrucomicrobiae bacterium]